MLRSTQHRAALKCIELRLNEVTIEQVRTSDVAACAQSIDGI